MAIVPAISNKIEIAAQLSLTSSGCQCYLISKYLLYTRKLASIEFFLAYHEIYILA